MLNLRNIYIPSFLLTMPFAVYSAGQHSPSFTGCDYKVIEIQPDKNTGLDGILVLYDTNGVNMFFPMVNPSVGKVYKYSNLGGGYAEEINDFIRTSDGVTLENIEGNLGYIFEEGSTRYYFWVVDYHDYIFSIESISPSAMQECDVSVLDVEGNAPAIHYFTINGQQRELSRDITVSFDTQEYDSNSLSFRNVPKKITLSSFDRTIRISPASLAYTAFHIEGDRFLKQWNSVCEAESIVVTPTAVAIVSTAEQVGDTSGSKRGYNRDVSSEASDTGNESDTSNSEPSNVIKGDDTALGGSAPADITFSAFVSDGVMHYEWQMSRNPDFEDVDYRFNVQQLDYTFLEEGTYYLRFIGSNSDGSCEAVGDTYTVTIGSSELLCPNAFSPDGDGVNDIWKISYRSLVEFDCWIFDRYGAEMYHYTDPQGGWDGMKGGKVVKPGVYYYVITATGADGKKYKKSGDINILRRNNISGQGSAESE